MTETPAHAPWLVQFGVYELDLHSGELGKSGARLTLQQRPRQLLSVLLEQPGELVTRDELRKRLWPDDTFVDFEHALNAAVKRLRDTLGERWWGSPSEDCMWSWVSAFSPDGTSLAVACMMSFGANSCSMC
jgi:DNA-binding response OmpR family regulator